MTAAFLTGIIDFVAQLMQAFGVRSDDGSNFISVANELKDMCDLLNSEWFQKDIFEFCYSHSIQWKFIAEHVFSCVASVNSSKEHES